LMWVPSMNVIDLICSCFFVAEGVAMPPK
jgi:hypothetical protein